LALQDAYPGCIGVSPLASSHKALHQKVKVVKSYYLDNRFFSIKSSARASACLCLVLTGMQSNTNGGTLCNTLISDIGNFPCGAELSASLRKSRFVYPKQFGQVI